MKIIKPNWVKQEHKGIPLSIFSIDIHPDGTRFATGGQGNDCGRVAIWNFSAVISTKVENDENQPKLLCQIDSHLQCVNSVRWSHAGNYLASAGDDKLIMIWQLGGRYQGHTEHYRTVSTLRSHSGDILDLSWSHDDRYLASCSIDNMIVIWNAQRWPEIAKILKGHCGLVKGVTWDPIGKYLASQSADKTLRIWRISDWSEEVCIKEPFEQCGDTTHVLRLSWSPEGQYLVSAQAMNNCGSVAKIIERQDWSFLRDFVGHRKAIPCARFNPNMFKFFAKPKKKKGQNEAETNNKDVKDSQRQKFKTHCICALGSRDRSISIWSTARQRPLVVIDDVFGNSVVDLSWSRCGYQLLACSVDGGVICFQFDPKELGSIYDQEERVQFLQQLYGNSLFSPTNSIGNKLIEDMDILLLQQKDDKKNESSQNGLSFNSDGSVKQLGNSTNQNDSEQKKTVNTTLLKSSTTSPSSSSSSSMVENKEPPKSSTNHSPGRLAKGPTDKQIEIRSADGRRRIIPLFIPPTTVAPDSVANNTDTNNSISNQQKPPSSSASSRPISFSSSSESKSKIVIETLDESNPGSNLHEAYQYLNSNSFNGFGKSLDSNAKDPTDKMQTNGESETNGEILKNSSFPNELASSTNHNVMQNKSSDDSSDNEIVIKRSKSLKRPPSKQLTTSVERQAKRKASKSTSGAPISLTKSNFGAQDSINTVTISNNEMTKCTEPKISSSNKSSSSMINITTTKPSSSTPNLNIQMTTTNGQQSSQISSTPNFIFPPSRLPRQNQSSIRLFTRSEDGKQFAVSIEYPLSSSGICKLSAFVHDQLYWSVMISDPILAVAGSEELVACFCQDYTLQVFHSSDGRRLFVPVILDSPVARMTCANKFHLLMITSNARLWLWDFRIPKVLVHGESLVPLLLDPKKSEQFSLQGASVSSTSKPIVTVSNGRTYIFEPDFQSWCLLNDLNDPLNSCTELRPCAVNTIKQLSSFSKFPSRSIMNFFSSNIPMAQQSAMSFMEKQIEIAKLIGSSDEYRYWILNFVKQLVTMHSNGGGMHAANIENRLKELCKNLLGPPFSLQLLEQKNTQSIVGVNKHNLLREILSILASNLGLQRLYLEFKDSLDSVANSTKSMLKNPFATRTTSNDFNVGDSNKNEDEQKLTQNE
ncbi:hypothetical protein DERP_008050 [Dermatophagoides pteronyssinus]|uniref:Protein HIRA n=1 Tax=Dermatophagoides pteronyssinus TaxID=6956 RepID=A0ABQ8JK13_DERPT|nr:hypothetical protein DERP_008050 [Dermatophagoides pteronyssinus]